MNSLQLKEKRGQVFAEMKDIRGKLGTDGNFTDATTETHYRNLDTEFTKLSAQIEDAERFEAREKEFAAASYEQQRASNTGAPQFKQGQEGPTYDEAFWRYIRRDRDDVIPPEDLRLLRTREQRGTATQITSTNTLGGFTVPQSFSYQLENVMKWYGGMLEACGLMPTSIGGTLTWPTADDTAVTGNINTQANQAAARTVSDLAFGQVAFTDYIIDSNIVLISRALLQDNQINIEQVIAEDLGARLGRKFNSAFTTGTGTNEPYGLTTVVTGAGKTAASTTAFTKNEIIDLTHSIDKAYRQSGPGARTRFMMHDLTLAFARKLDVGNTDTVQIFYPGLVAGEPDRLLGFPISINNDLDSAFTTGKKLIYFGDFSKYKIRQVAPIAIDRNDYLYWDKISVGFMGYMRADGNLINQSAIKFLKLG